MIVGPSAAGVHPIAEARSTLRPYAVVPLVLIAVGALEAGSEGQRGQPAAEIG